MERHLGHEVEVKEPATTRRRINERLTQLEEEDVAAESGHALSARR